MLDVSGISMRFGSIRALDDVSFGVGAGEIVALVGENGAGKSTAVRAVARALLPDAGTISVAGEELGRSPRAAIDAGVAVVWQDLALCENLDVTANLFLGRELGRGGALRRVAMHTETTAVFRDLGVRIPELDRPVERLSGGQRQLVAIGRATIGRPKLLVLDEPTAALGVRESQVVLDVVRRLRDRGVAILMVSHNLDEVFDIADRIVVLRHGRVAADLHRSETHHDDVVALITGVDVDSTANQHLRRLHSLAEQLADADQSVVLPLTVSSLSGALGIERVALYTEAGVDEDGRTILRCSASLKLPGELAEAIGPIVVGRDDNFVATAAAEAAIVTVPDLRAATGSELARRAATAGLVGAWAAPVVGQRGTMAAIVGFTDTVGQLQPDQVQLLELFSTMAGAAIDRGRLVETLRVQNRSLEGLHGVLETLAGPELVSGSMSLALDAVCRGLNAQAAHLFVDVGEGWAVRERSSGADDRAHAAVDTAVLEGAEADAIRVDRFDWSRGRAALACWWGEAIPPPEAGQLLAGAANSFRLAMERELTAEAEREAAALQRSREFERELARRLGHELRTPLTAIRGFASTMLQPDVQWPESEKARFLGVIETEADRMGRLVAQLFDDSAIESGTLRLDMNYCDLVAAVDRAASIAAPPGVITTDLPERLPVWADSDRLEQVFVNLFANAVRHNAEGTKVRVTLADESPADGAVAIAVRDDGVGIPEHELGYLNGDHDDRHEMGGLGLRLVRGFVRAHGGTVRAQVGGGTTVIVTLPLDEETT